MFLFLLARTGWPNPGRSQTLASAARGQERVRAVYRKLENRGGHCTLGFLICTERFAETLHLEALRDSKDRLRVVPIDGDDLRRLVEAAEREVALRELVERAVLT